MAIAGAVSLTRMPWFSGMQAGITRFDFYKSRCYYANRLAVRMNWWVVALRLTGLGWYVALCIVSGIVGGLALDRAVGLTPLFTLVGVVLGSIVAFWGLYKMVQPLLYGSKREDTNGKRGDH